MNDLKKVHLEDEKPIIEFPALVIIGVIFMSFCVSLSVLFLPWYLSLTLFVVLCLSVAIFFKLYVGILVFLLGAFFHPASVFPQLQALRPALFLAIGILFVWGLHVIIFHDFHIVKVPQNLFIVIFMGLAFVSTLRNFDLISPFFFEFSTKSLVLYFAISNEVKTERQVNILMWFLIICNVVLCLIGFYWYAHGIGEMAGGILRIKVFADESNVFALDLTIALPLALGLFLWHKNVFLKIFFGGVISLLLLTIIFTFSRAGYLQLIGVLVIFFGLRLFEKKKIIAILLIAFMAFAILQVTLVMPGKYGERMRSIAEFSEYSAGRRLVGWQNGLEMMLDHPVSGVGIGVFKYAFVEHAIEKGRWGQRFYQEPTDAHNVYLQIGGELGLPGLALFLLLIIWTLKDLNIARKNFIKKNKLLLAETSFCFEVSFIAFLIGAMFLSFYHLIILWIIIPLAVVLKQLSLKENEI